MTGRLRLLFALPLALAAAGAWAQQQPATVQLRHRSAESLVTVLRPLVAPATLAGAGTQLQVRASPSDLPRVMRLIEQSDRPPRPLAVALSDEPPTVARSQPPVQDGSVTLSTGRPLAPDPYGNGQTLSTQPGQSRAAVLEGEPLRISMPASQSLWVGVHGGGGSPTGAAPGAGAGGRASGGVDAAGVVHFDAISDFTARIWLAGTTVAIELQPLAAGRVDGGTDASVEHATVYGRVGQWIALADSGADAPSPNSGASGAPRAGLWIKVDAAPDLPGSE